MDRVEITFSTAGNRNYVLSIAEPKEGLTKAEVQASAEKLAKVLENRSGVALTGFVKAEIVHQSREELT